MRNSRNHITSSRATVEDRALVLYEKLLEIMLQEKEEIEEKNIDRIDHYMSRKVEILREVDELKASDQWLKSERLHALLSETIERVIELNEANANAVRSIKRNMQNEIAVLHKSRVAHKAYNMGK